MNASTALAVVLLLLALLVLGYGVVIYNRLVALKHNVSKSWSNIDVLLKQRHDELPKLVETCKQYMGFEQETLRQVMEARNAVHDARQRSDLQDLGGAERTLHQGLLNLFALAENYPDLKANQSFQNLQSRISALEDAIADRREFYNEAVNNHNVRIEQFPDVIVARRFGFRPQTLLQVDEAERVDVNVSALFAG